MKSFFAFALAWIVLLAASLCWSAESTFVESLAEERWGDAVKETKWATSAYVSKCFPGVEVYYVRLVNRASGRAGPPTRLATIVLRGRDATFLESDSDAAAYFSKSKLKVKDTRDATIAARAFADLRGYKLVTAPPGGEAASPASDWLVSTESSRTGWTVGCTLLDAGVCFRYDMKASRKGEMSVKNVKHVYGILYE
jgi:hypothetical protein